MFTSEVKEKKWDEVYQKNSIVTKLFEKSAQLNPKHTAIECYGEKISYQQLNEKSNQLARTLKSLGKSPDQPQPHGNVPGTIRVGVHLEQDIDLIISLFGILKAGYVFVPLPMDKDISETRLSAAIEELRPQIILTKGCHEKTVVVNVASAINTNIIYIDNLEANLSGQNLESIPSIHDVAYIYFTSGSTGNPKGVINNHEGLMDVMESHIEALRINQDSHVAQIASIAFDASLIEIFMTLLAGATLHIAPRDKDGALCIKQLPDFFRTCKIDKAIFTPTLLSIFSPTEFSMLTDFVYTGESMDPQTKLKWNVEANPNAWDGYGLTECRIGSLLNGLPMNNVKLYICQYHENEQKAEPSLKLKICDIGKPGEILIGGSGVGQGYWNNPELTQKFFIETIDPTDDSKKIRLYRTGDLGVKTLDNRYQIVGRIGEQIKINGKLMFPKETQQALLNFNPGIIQRVFVDAIEENNGSAPKLVAFIFVNDFELLRDNGGFPCLTEIQRYLESKLTKFMIPCRWVFLPNSDNFKIYNVNNKFDRKLLWEFWLQNSEDYPLVFSQQWREISQTDNKDVQKIIDIWCRTLSLGEASQESIVSDGTSLKQRIYAKLKNIEKNYHVKYDDHFFYLGGTSISSVLLLDEIERQLQLSINEIEFFKNPTIGFLIRRYFLSKFESSQPNSCLINLTGNYSVDHLLPSGVMPVILFHALLGDARKDYLKVINYFPKDYPIFAVDAPGLKFPEIMWDNFDEMADRIIPLIKKIYRGNSLILAGWSAGGFEALATQQALEKMGYHVWTIMFDSASPTFIKNHTPGRFERFLRTLFLDNNSERNIRKRMLKITDQQLNNIFSEIKFNYWPKSRIIMELACRLKVEIQKIELGSAEHKSILIGLITTVENILLSSLKMSLPSQVDNLTLYVSSESKKRFGELLGWPGHWRIEAKYLEGDHFFMLNDSILSRLDLLSQIKKIAENLWIKTLDVRDPNARAYADNLVRNQPGNPQWRLARAKIRAHTGDRGSALADLNDVFKKVSKGDELYKKALLEKAITHQRLVDFTDGQEKTNHLNMAVECFKELIQLKVFEPKVRVECGYCYFLKNDYSKALTMYASSLEISTEYYQVYFYRAKLYIELNQYQQARNDLQQFLQFKPEHQEARAMLMGIAVDFPQEVEENLLQISTETPSCRIC